MRPIFVAAAALIATAAACSRPGPRPEPAPRALTVPESVALQPSTSAIALFERRCAADPRDHLSAATLAELHLRRGDETGRVESYRAAERAARTALERMPDYPAAVVYLARALSGQGDVAESRRLVHGLLDANPRNVPALCAAFDLALAAGEQNAARAYADRLLAINEEPATLSRMAQLAEGRGDVDGALDLFHSAAEGARDLGGLPAEIAEYRRRAGRALLAAGRLDDAEREFEAAVAVNPREAEAWRARAEISERRGDLRAAAEAMRSAVAIRGTPDYVARLTALQAATRAPR